jgi:hypothetical protein
MIGLDEIQDIVQIAVYSGALKDELPLSVGLIANPGTGKSSVVGKTYKQPPPPKAVNIGSGKTKKTIYIRQVSGSVLYTTNTTPYYLYTRFGDILRSGQIKHIAMPDFLNILNQPKYVLSQHVTFYNNLIEEGILSIESRDGQFVAEVPVKVGLITAIAKTDYDNRKDDWVACGFTSRIVPISFKYSDATGKKIRDSVKVKDYLNEKNFEITLPPETAISLPLHFADIIEEVALRTKDTNDETGARRQKQLQVFCMANALKDGRDEVGMEDIEKLLSYEKYFNWECKATI